VERVARDRRSPAKRELILEAATKLFLSEGFARVSVDGIAASAGVGKQTVYSHFGNKEQLFLAVVERARATAGLAEDGAVRQAEDAADPRAYLEAVGENILRVVLSPDVAALHRLTIAELTHHPELQSSWGETGPDDLRTAITDHLAAAGHAGMLDVPDPGRTARQFVLLVATEGRVRSLHGTRPVSDAEQREIARQCAELIIRAHRMPR
jgi:TetR/AcrR family transcriptional repressor of mexJK operon